MPAGLIAAVAPGSLAGRASLRPGDELVSINGCRLRDVIDVQFCGAEERLALQVRRGGRHHGWEKYTIVDVERQYDEPLGLDFVHPTFDGIRRCNNRCEFCFVAQMPARMRRSLYVKDDDYRYSFLFGSYVTLTNLDEPDWERIGEQHLSPLYVSVHATDVDLRRRVLHNPAAPDVMPQLRRLAGLGVEVHTQIVLVPGLNDGAHLDRSIRDLAGLYPAVRSVSVVPVGLTRYHRGHCRTHTRAEMRVVFEGVSAWQARLRERLGASFVYLSDEWYLRLGEDVPPAEHYDDLDLTENGVGLVRRFLDSRPQFLEPQCAALHPPTSTLQPPPSNFQPPTSNLQPPTSTLVTGTLFAPLLRRTVAHLPGVDVIPVVNRFFGDTVTVAGLLTAQDVVAQLGAQDLGDVVCLPSAMFGGPEGQSLDEMWPRDVGEALGRRVIAQ